MKEQQTLLITEETLTPLITRYYRILSNYRKGLYGKEHLTMHEILNRAGEPNLFNMMSLDEIDYLLETSTGQTRNMFALIKNKKENLQVTPKGRKLKKQTDISPPKRP